MGGHGPAGTAPPDSIITWSGRPRSSLFLSPSSLPLPRLFQMETFLWGVPAEWLKPRSLLGVHSIQGRGTQPCPSTVGEQTGHSYPSWDLGLPPATLSPPCSGARAARKPVGHVKRPTGSYLDGGERKFPCSPPTGRERPGFLHTLHWSQASFLSLSWPMGMEEGYSDLHGNGPMFMKWHLLSRQNQ